MFWRKKNKFDDATTSALMSKGIYSVHYPEEKQNKWWIAWKEHNILTGMWYVFILSCLLWWLPVFGQMIAGYLGGRRAGSPIKGVMVAIIPVFVIMLLLVGMDAGMFPFLASLAAVPGMMINGLSGISPSAGSYLGGIFESLEPLVGLNGNGFLIVLVFAMIGGLMADMNKKEIAKATGSGSGLFGGFSAMASAASLNKLADMVAERVIWTMSLVGNGGKTLIATTHHAPKEMGFSDLQMLPASTSEPARYSSFQEAEVYQPSQSYAYEDPIYQEKQFDDMDDLYIKDVSVEPISQEEYADYDGWGISHYDLTEESMTDRWIEQNKRMEPKTPRKKYGSKKGKHSARLRDDRGARFPKRKEMRDAMVFDGKGNEIKKAKPRKKAQPKKNHSSLVSRAMEADKKINREPERAPVVLDGPDPQEDVMAAEETMEKVARPRTKPVASYERL